MAFLYSAIGDNTKENREHLEKIGYEKSNKELWQIFDGNRLMCIKCRKILPIYMFDKKTKTKRGYSCKCKQCNDRISKVKSLSGETWRPVVGYENYYSVSNLGRVKSIIRIVENKNSKILRGERILKQSVKKNGYLSVPLQVNKNKKNFMVHRLVAAAYLPEKNGNLHVNHKDENKSNNNIENLEWCTQKYNNNYGSRNERISKANKGKIIGDRPDLSVIFKSMVSNGAFGAKKVYKVDMQDYSIITVYDSISQAAKDNNLFKTQISRRLSLYSKSINGYYYLNKASLAELQEHFK